MADMFKKITLFKILVVLLACVSLAFVLFRVRLHIQVDVNNSKSGEEKISEDVERKNNFYETSPISIYPEVGDRPICDVKTSEKIVSFSFDDGYNYENTKKIVDILKKNGNLKATFFFCGNAIDGDVKNAKNQGRENSVELVHNAGHEIANHSNSHPNFKKLTKGKMEEEIENCNKKIENITGKRPVLFRFPYGSHSKESVEVVKKLDMYPVDWNIDTLDWNKKSSCDSICSSICKGYKTNNVSYPHPGSIILMHTTGKYTPEALEIIIPILLKGGYKIVTVSDLILSASSKNTKENMNTSMPELISSVS